MYKENLLEPLLQTIFALSGPKTTILVCYFLGFSFNYFFLKIVIDALVVSIGKIGYEIRSTSVHEQMLQMWKRNFDVKTVPNSKVQFSFCNANPNTCPCGLQVKFLVPVTCRLHVSAWIELLIFLGANLLQGLASFIMHHI